MSRYWRTEARAQAKALLDAALRLRDRELAELDLVVRQRLEAERHALVDEAVALEVRAER